MCFVVGFGVLLEEGLLGKGIAGKEVGEEEDTKYLFIFGERKK